MQGPPPSLRREFARMSTTMKDRMNLGLLWTILATMAAGVYQAGQIRQEIQTISHEVVRIRPLEERMLRVEVALGLTAHKGFQDPRKSE